MGRNQVSLTQLWCMLVAMIVSAGHFLFVRIILLETGRSAWLTVFPAALVGIVAFYGVLSLMRRFSNKTLIGASFDIYGPWLGRVMTLPYLVFFIDAPSIIVRAMGDFIPHSLRYTPYLVVTGILVTLCAIVVRQGIEVIGRCAQAILPILIALGLLASILTAKDKRMEHLLPMLDKGFVGLIHGSIPLAGLFCEVVVAGMIVHKVDQTRGLRRTPLWFFVVMAVMFIGPLSGPPAVFGPEVAARFQYPTYQEIRYIEIQNVFERLDVFGIILWALGSFLKVSLFLYAISVGLAEWLGLKDYRGLVFPLTPLLVVFATKIGPNQQVLWEYLHISYPLFLLFVGLLLPWLTLLIDTLKRQHTKEDATPPVRRKTEGSWT